MKHKKHFFTIFLGLILSLVFFTSSIAQIVLSSQAEVNGFSQTVVTGNLEIRDNLDGTQDIEDLTPLNILTSVSGLLLIMESDALTNLDGLESLTSVGSLSIGNNDALTNLDGLENLTSVGAGVNIVANDALTDLGGLGSLTSVGASLTISQNSALTNIDGLGSLTSVGGNLWIQSNPALTNIDGLQNLTSVGGAVSHPLIHIDYNDALKDVDGLQNITSINNLRIFYNAALTNLDGLQNLISVSEDLTITHNPALVSFCGLYPLCSSGGVHQSDCHINNNGANPIVAEIIAGGACPVKVVDIKPNTCPNSFNVDSKGNIPVAILGTDDFDVHNIDPATLLLEGISPLRWSIKDIAAPVIGSDECDCTIDGPDGFDDLNLKFDSQELAAALGSVNYGDELVLTITGEMLDGTPFWGSDCVVIEAKGPYKELPGNLSTAPEKYALFGNYPNPFNPSTTIKFAVPEESFIKLEVYNTLGEKVNTLLAETLTAGIYSVDWNGTDLSSGIYIYRLQAGSFVETKKMVLLR